MADQHSIQHCGPTEPTDSSIMSPSRGGPQPLYQSTIEGNGSTKKTFHPRFRATSHVSDATNKPSRIVKPSTRTQERAAAITSRHLADEAIRSIENELPKSGEGGGGYGIDTKEHSGQETTEGELDIHSQCTHDDNTCVIQESDDVNKATDTGGDEEQDGENDGENDEEEDEEEEIDSDEEESDSDEEEGFANDEERRRTEYIHACFRRFIEGRSPLPDFDSSEAAATSSGEKVEEADENNDEEESDGDEEEGFANDEERRRTEYIHACFRRFVEGRSPLPDFNSFEAAAHLSEEKVDED